MKVKSDHRSKFSNLSNWKEEAWKKLKIAQLVEHRTRYRGGHGFESHWSPDIFFRLLLSNCLNWKIYCDDHSSLSYVNIYRRYTICHRHWSPACLRSWTQLNFAGKSVVNAWDRLCVGDKCSHMPQLSQAVPAAMSQVGRRHMRTRHNTQYEPALN